MRALIAIERAASTGLPQAISAQPRSRHPTPDMVRLAHNRSSPRSLTCVGRPLAPKTAIRNSLQLIVRLLKWLQNGREERQPTQAPKKMAALGIQTLVDMKAGKTVAMSTDPGTVLMTKENAAQYK